ncbi:hypothetical protein ACHAXR_003189 [Thalassiosira sp. AJA248-18]
MLAKMEAHMNELENKCQSMQREMDGMKDKSQFLEAKCGSLERTLQSLTKCKEWEYSAPPVPSRHWTELGFDEDYIYRMDSFLEDVKIITCKLRGGEHLQDISLGDGRSDEIMLYDDILLPHWREFVDALQLNNSSGYSNSFSISKVQLPSVVLDMIAPALRGKGFNYFGFDHNEFADAIDGTEFGIKFIHNNPNLIYFKWVNNPINSVEGVGRLVEAINSLTSLKSVLLENCCGDNVNGYSILRSLLTMNENLDIIDLDSDNIQTMGGTHLSDFLATNPPLRKLFLENDNLNDHDARLIASSLMQNTNLRDLYLGDNGITDAGCSAFAEALKQNNSLTVLALYGNEITERGWKLLQNAVFDSSDLNSAADSNHTCEIRGIPIEIGINNSSDCPKENMKKKIYSMLCSRNNEGSTAYHLNLELGDNSLQLVPKVLERLRNCCYNGDGEERATSPPLSIFYEIIRSWKMPTLFEAHSDLISVMFTQPAVGI